MSRTPPFHAVRRALRRSLWLAKHAGSESTLLDREASRREFLKSSLALGAAALPLPMLLARCASAPMPARPFGAADPVIVIGGGLAGLTTAYRLARAGVKVEVYEAQARWGGRVLTQDRFNAEGMFCELGGELIDSTHADALGLAAELGLRTDDFRTFDAKVRRHQFYFGGRHYFDEDLTAACRPVARRLLEDMRQIFPDPANPVVTYDAHTPAARAFDQVSLEEYLGRIGDAEPWVRDAINIAYLTEFGLDTGEQSCLNLMALIDPSPDHGFGIYGESDEALRIRGGNGRLVAALVGALAKAPGVRLEPGQRLVRMEDLGDAVGLTFEAGGKARVVRAARTVCTVPFSVLREVEGVAALPLHPVKQKCIAQLGYGTNTKQIVGYRRRIWRRPHGAVPGASGYTFTDLPSQTLWDSSRAQRGESGIITTFLGGRAAVDPARASVESTLTDVEKIHPGSRALHDGNHALARWPSNPFVKGSYACPRVGQYTTLLGSAKETELGGKLLFAGEHVSEKYQGYMNGAVQTGNLASRRLIAELGGTGRG